MEKLIQSCWQFSLFNQYARHYLIFNHTLLQQKRLSKHAPVDNALTVAKRWIDQNLAYLVSFVRQLPWNDNQARQVWMVRSDSSLSRLFPQLSICRDSMLLPFQEEYSSGFLPCLRVASVATAETLREPDKHPPCRMRYLFLCPYWTG